MFKLKNCALVKKVYHLYRLVKPGKTTVITKQSLQDACKLLPNNSLTLIWFLIGEKNSQKSKNVLKEMLKLVSINYLKKVIAGVDQIQGLPKTEKDKLIFGLIFTDPDLTLEIFNSAFARSSKEIPLLTKVVFSMPFIGRKAKELTMDYAGLDGKQIYQMIKNKEITSKEVDKVLCLAALLLAHEEWRASKQ